jgi:hypothetical protein
MGLGSLLVGVVIPGWFFLGAAYGGLVMMVLSCGACVVGGMAVMAQGAQLAIRSTRHLHAVTEMKKLPVARARLLPP